MREVDHADTIAQREVLGVGHFPEVAVVPLGFTGRHLIAVLGQHRVFVGCIPVGSLPAGHFHKVATQRDFTLVEGTHTELTRRGVRLARVHRRGVDLLCDLVAAVANELVRKLNWIVPRRVDAMRIHLGAAVGHPVGQQLAGTGAVFYPDRLTEPKILHLWRLTNNRTAIGGHRQQTVE